MTTATLTKKVKSPVSRYPGSKRLYIDALVVDAPKVDAILEPFAGAAYYSINRLINGASAAFLGETDITIQALYWVLGHKELSEPYTRQFMQWVSFYKRELNADAKAAWEQMNTEIASVFSKLETLGDAGPATYITKLAALGAVLRQLTFGGVIRCNGKGEQNAPLVTGQLEKIQRWQPFILQNEFARKLDVSPDYSQAIAAFKASDFATAEAYIDPPYFAPREECPRTQTASYWGHEPHGEATLAMCIDAFTQCLQDERLKRIVVTNYVSQTLDSKLRSLAGDVGLDVEFVEGTTLKTMQRTTRLTDGAKQGFWQVRRA